MNCPLGRDCKNCKWNVVKPDKVLINKRLKEEEDGGDKFYFTQDLLVDDCAIRIFSEKIL
jgi:hypothetical protein